MSRLAAIKRRPHAGDGDGEGEGSWAISYGDMLTLLLAFFILFFSITPKEQRETALKSSLLTTLKPLEKSRPFQEAFPDLKDLKILDQSLNRKWKAKVREVGGKVVLEFPGVSFFDSGATDANAQGREALKAFAKLYVPYAGTHMVTVIGFADSRPVSRPHRYKDNLELSVLRSVSALRELQAQGLPLSRVRLGGYGVSQSENGKLQELIGAKDEDALHGLARKIVLVIEPEETP